MVSHLSCHYSIFIFFLLVDVFRIFVLRYFFITFLFRKQIGKVSSESFLANMPYTRSSLTIVRSCLRQFMQSPFKGLYRYFLHIELAICKITITLRNINHIVSRFGQPSSATEIMLLNQRLYEVHRVTQ